jgi:anti-sigma factor RsiW
VTSKPCPTETELLAFADADLSPEKLERVEQHLEVCSSCARQVVALTRLIEDIAAPLAPADQDLGEHVAAVMKRLDEPVKSQPARALTWGAVTVAVLAAAAALLFVRGHSGDELERGQLAARGGLSEPALSRDVGVQLYTQTPDLRALTAGSKIQARSSLTAGLRNTGRAPVYLLLFAVDAQHAVHWIAPEFTVPGSNPRAVSLAPHAEERLLPTAAVFDDLAPGPLRLIALLSAEPSSVADVESLTPEQLSSHGLTARFPRAEVRELAVEVSP